MLRFGVLLTFLVSFLEGAVAATAESWYLQGPYVDVVAGELVDDGIIAIEEARIVAVGTRQTLTPPADARIVEIDAGYIVPGLIDAHVHLLSDPSLQGYAALGASLPQRTLLGVVNARKTLAAGITTVRMVGAQGFADIALRDAIENGSIPGPRVVTAGMAIGITGGHCSDNNLLPFEHERIGDGVADGPWAMRAKVRRNVKFGADFIKTCSTGGVMTKNTSVGAPQGTLEELTALVDEAHSQGMKVAAHAHGSEGVMNAIEANVDSVEHASFIDAAGIKLAKRKGVSLVMDIYVTEYILSQGEAQGFLPESLEKERKTGAIQRQNFRAAHAAGVTLVFGTDAGLFPHGDNLKQLSRMVTWGMTPAEALRSATLNAAELLGLAGQVGNIAVGGYADFAIVEENPLEDVSTLENVLRVMKGGHWITPDA